MKRFALFCFLSVAVTAQATTWSTNGQASDVQAKHAQASNGDTITIPAGNFTWPLNGVYITKAITLDGAGVGATNITLSGTHPGLRITKNATGIIKIQDMTFIATGGAGTLPDPIWLDGTWPAGQPIIFSNVGMTLSGESMVSCDLAGGVIFSHITFSGGWNDFFISVKDQTNTSSWTTADSIGIRDTMGTKNIYIEDSTFTGGSNGIIDCDDNCRVVMRHNTAHNSGFYNSHGKDTSTYGARHFEIYENTLDLPDKSCSGCGNVCLSNVGQYVWIRGATGVVYNNSMEHLSTSCWGLKNEIRVNIRGAEDARPQGACNQVVYPVPHQCGQNNNGTSDFADPIWFWGNTGTVINVNSAWAWGNPCAFNWNTFWQWGRDGQNTALTLPIVLPSIGGSVSGLGGTAKPGYTAFTYPHPLLSGSPTPTAAPTATATVTVTPTATPDVPATCTRTMTVDHTKVPSTQTNFTVLVSVTDDALRTVGNGGHVQNANGYDIGFYSDSGGTTKLKWEMESYNGTTGTVVAWVKIASLSSSSDTLFYMIYGDASIVTDQSDPTNTWDTSFSEVWHMADNAASTTILATIGTNAANVANTSTKTNASGKIGRALNYNGSTDGSSSAINLSSSPIITLSFWMNWTTNSGDDDLAFEYTNNYNNKDGFIVDWNSSTGGQSFEVGMSSFDTKFWSDTTAQPSAGSWHLVDVVFNRTTPVNKVYVDGSLQTLTPGSQGLNPGTNFANSTLYFMSRGTSSLNGAGVLDEVKVSTSERSANWITAEYNNQSSPGSFLTMSAETCGSPSPSPTATVTVTPTPTPAATPAPPSGLHVASVSGAVTLQWTINTAPDSVTSYNIYRVTAGTGANIGTTTDPSFDVSSFLTGSRTRFYVTAVNAIGEGPPSHKVTVQQH